MDPESFRRAAHELVDWIADYRMRLDGMPVRAQVDPGEIRAALPDTPPRGPVAAAELLETLEQQILPGITHMQHPMQFGWFPANASLASVLGDMAAAGLGTLGISWESCPALTEVEEVVCDWMRQLSGLSDQWQGCIHDGASTVCLVSLLVARERACGYPQFENGLQAEPSPLTVYTTEEAHSSVAKAALLAGFGRNNLRMVGMRPEDRSMCPAALHETIRRDIGNGCRPVAIVASTGSTGVTAFDPVRDIAEIARRHDMWLHVDAAMAGNAMMLPECRHLWDGVEMADSLCWNPHKWLGAVLDTSLFYVRNPADLVQAMSTNPSYLRSEVDAEVRQFRDWGIPLGRRFRALKLWYLLQIDGIENIRARLRQNMESARWLAREVESTPHWKVLAPVKLQTVCIRHEPPGLEGSALDDHTLGWVHDINHGGDAFMSPSILDGRWMARVSVGVETTTHEHVEALWKLIRGKAADRSQ